MLVFASSSSRLGIWRGRSFATTSASDPPATSARQARLRENQRGDLVAVVPGEHDVAPRARSDAETSRAQRARAHPRAGGELEILGEAAVEDKSLAGSRGIGKRNASPRQ